MILWLGVIFGGSALVLCCAVAASRSRRPPVAPAQFDHRVYTLEEILGERPQDRS